MRQATCSGMGPEHGPLFPRPDSRGQGSPALRPQDFGHHFPKAAAGAPPAGQEAGDIASRQPSQQDLAARATVSNDVISKIETGERPPAGDFPPRLDAVPELDTRGALTRLREHLNKGHKQRPYGWFQRWAGIEAQATVLRWYEPLVVPGLLQTEEYARAILSARPDGNLGDIDEQVAARLVPVQEPVENASFRAGERLVDPGNVGRSPAHHAMLADRRSAGKPGGPDPCAPAAWPGLPALKSVVLGLDRPTRFPSS